MSDGRDMEQPLVFGLDIGTRNVVGTVGYRTEDQFIVTAQYIMQHDTRAMLDGQIHDIGRVSGTIRKVKEQLEKQIGEPLTEVCIAAAGRVLKTVTTNITYEYPEESVVTGEDIHTLDLLGIEKAQKILQEMNDTNYKFYCVGYSVVKYFLNDEPFSNIESHKADRIGEDVIVTFLPEDVVDGLYAAVNQAGLEVANLTLEPIAAINVAIPESYRLLNIALVDIGAGTSDISITRDGSIIAYGMIPLAGDELTELIVQNYLVDFKTAEYIKLQSTTEDEITYKDIMLIEHKVTAKEVWELTEPIVDEMTTAVAAKIKELNGDQTVSAAFIVGGGGKIHGYTKMLAEKLELPDVRVALRGEEVLQEIVFEQKDIKKDPLLVTPIGICLSYYEQKNGFIMVRFNGERLKLYDNDGLTIVDAALQAGFPNEDLFPKRGPELNFFVNGAKRIIRGEQGESAAVYMNDRPANLNAALEPNCEIIIEPSTAGKPASCTLDQLEEYTSDSVAFVVNGNIIRCPKFLEVNGKLEFPSYQIKEGDQVETRSFYTVGQLAEFMDVDVNVEHVILVNNRRATLDSLIYENFTIEWTVRTYGKPSFQPVEQEEIKTPTVGEYKEEEIPDIVEPETNAEESVAADGAGAQNPAAAHNAVTAENTDDAGNAGAEGEDSAAGKDASTVEDSAAGVDGSVAGENAAGVDVSVTEDDLAGKAGTAVTEEDAAGMAEAAATEENTVGMSETAKKVTAEESSPAVTDRAAVTGEKPAVADSTVPAVTDVTTENAAAGQAAATAGEKPAAAATGQSMQEPEQQEDGSMVLVYINDQPVKLTGKSQYIFVDIFDFYEFDLTASNGRAIITNLNGENASYSAVLKTGDTIELRWKEN